MNRLAVRAVVEPLLADFRGTSSEESRDKAVKKKGLVVIPYKIMVVWIQ